jgi:hypothetical protein|eukprot:COSAG02_NODE_5261_length_4489_cov_10.826879_2_plen_57_part_00
MDGQHAIALHSLTVFSVTGEIAVGEEVSGLRIVRLGEEDLTHTWHTYAQLRSVEHL